MKLGRLNHIGVATPSIADSIRYYRDTMGAVQIAEPFDLPEQGVKVCFVDTPDAAGEVGKGTQIELIEPFDEASPPAASTMSATRSRISSRRANGSRGRASASSAPRASARMARRSSSSTRRT